MEVERERHVSGILVSLKALPRERRTGSVGRGWALELWNRCPLGVEEVPADAALGSVVINFPVDIFCDRFRIKRW